MADQKANSAAIAQFGSALGPQVLAASRALYAEVQQPLLDAQPAIARDCAYGPHPRHRLDLYRTGEASALRPVVLFVHGGGFVQGDKSADGWPNAAVGRWAAGQGWLGAVMNYRLAPDHGWPAGGEDVLAVLDWLTANAADHGGDPERIVLLGTSAGAVHIATALRLRPALAVRGCVLLSGLYGYTPLEGRDGLYYGDADLYAERMPRMAVAQTEVPLLLISAEFDPPRFHAEFLGLLQERLEQRGMMPRAYVASGHNHYTTALHLGSSDRRVADEITGFVGQCCG